MCASEHEFEVKDEQKFFVLNLQTQSCDCGRWEVTGKRLNVADYVDKSLTKAAYLKTYGYVIHPIPDQSHWPIVGERSGLPLPKKRLPGFLLCRMVGILFAGQHLLFWIYLLVLWLVGAMWELEGVSVCIVLILASMTFVHDILHIFCSIGSQHTSFGP
ncbi:hypothetical protein ACOSQ2_008335 [Xanthoceras sorbifolium]